MNGANIADSQKINLEPTTKEEKAEAEQTKLQNNDKTQTTAPAAPVENKIAISRASQDNHTKDVIIQTRLDGANWQQCTLTLKQGANIITKTAKVLYQDEFSTCTGFALRGSEFVATGQWNVNLDVKHADGSTSSAQDILTITR